MASTEPSRTPDRDAPEARQAAGVAILYPLITVNTAKIVLITLSMLIALLVLFLPAAVHLCADAPCLAEQAYHVAIVIPEVANLARTGTLPFATAMSYFSALVFGIACGGVLAITSFPSMPVNLAAGGLKGRMLRVLAYLLWGVQFIAPAPLVGSQQYSYEFFRAVGEHRPFLLLWSESMFFVSACVVVCVIAELTSVINRSVSS